MRGLVGSDEKFEVLGTASGDEAPEHGLFVFWERARRDEREILADLARRFRPIQAYEIRWTPALVRRNFERFYSDLEVRGVYHEISKGAGPFVAATLIDPHPVYDERQTSRGLRTVNTNFHDAKVEYRERVGHLGLHCSETAVETRRDLAMLLGLDVRQLDVDVPLEPWNGQVERIDIDIAGANGWDSESDLLRSLNASVSYVVLGGPAGGASLFDDTAEPQLLTSDYHAIHTVMNAKPVLGRPPRWGGRFTVDVGGCRQPLSIRPVGDGFIDSDWAHECLEHRILDDRQFYRPSEPDDLATRCYLALTRQRRLADGDRRLIRRLADEEFEGPGLASTQSIGRTEATEVINCYLSKRGYTHTFPRDPTVEHDIGGSGLEHVIRAGQGMLYVLTRGTSGFIRTRWLAARDALVFRAPALRKLIRRWTSPS